MIEPLRNFGAKNHLDLGILLLRIMFTLTLMINYGLPLLFDLVAGRFDFPDPLGIGSAPSLVLMGSAQLVFAAMVLLGIFTRWCCIPIILGFSVAFFVHHSADTFADKELAYLYLSAFIGLFFLGGGKFSIDRLWLKK